MRVDNLLHWEGSTLIVAQRKTGKTTLLLNLARSLLTGEDLLGRFPVRRPLAGQVCIMNYEVSASLLARWCRDAGVPLDRVYLVNLRGRRDPLEDPGDRAALAEWLAEQDVEAVVFDTFGEAYSGKSENDNAEVRAWFQSSSRFVRGEVGAKDMIVTVHAGWKGNHARGGSYLEGWADTLIHMRSEDQDDPTSKRYLSARGRDVEVAEDELAFDPGSRRLSLTGSGSLKAQRMKERDVDKTNALEPLVVEAVRSAPKPPSARELTQAVKGPAKERGVTGVTEHYVKLAAQLAENDGQIWRESLGTGKATLHHPGRRPSRSQGSETAPGRA